MTEQSPKPTQQNAELPGLDRQVLEHSRHWLLTGIYLRCPPASPGRPPVREYAFPDKQLSAIKLSVELRPNDGFADAIKEGSFRVETEKGANRFLHHRHDDAAALDAIFVFN